jgi:hypothetical protein
VRADLHDVTQLKFIKYELDTFSWYGKGPFKNSSTLRSATVAFQDYFERCVTYANQVYTRYA